MMYRRHTACICLWLAVYSYSSKVPVIKSSLRWSGFPTREEKPHVLKTFVDVFAGGQSGKPTLGSAKSTCWARGGICVHINYCRGIEDMDTGIAGCSSAYLVCCKVAKFGRPTVGIMRTLREVLVFSNNFEELEGESLEKLAVENSGLLSN